MNRRVVITGMGVIAPNASGLGEFTDALRNGRSGIRFIEDLREKNFACQLGAVPAVSGEARARYFSEEDLRLLSSNIEYGVMAGLDAWLDAGLRIPGASDEVDWDSGVIMGSGLPGCDTIADRLVPLTNEGKVKRLGSSIIEQIMASGTSGFLSGRLALGNRSNFVSSACATSTDSVIMAFERVQSGKARRMIAGGSEGYSPHIWAGFDSMRVLNRTSNDNPGAASRPMSASAAGFIPGAGGGALIVEELDSARERGANIYAEILGAASNCGGQRNGGTMTAPNAEGVRRCIREAIASAGIAAEEIDLISGHLTSTMADPLEIENWAEALGRKGKDFPFINSLKSMTGHCLGAAGALETIAGVIQLTKNFLHPSLNCEDIHPKISGIIDEEKITRVVKNAEPRILAKSSFGFGDVNSCLILKKWEGN